MKGQLNLSKVFLTTLLTGVLAWVAIGQTTTAPQTQPATQPETQPKEETPIVHVLLTTSKGDIVFELNREKAPVSVENFLTYAEEGYFDGTIFHRVISNFMIQGGGFTPDMKQKQTKKPIKNEWQNGLTNVRGSIAMARLGGQADSATSQFFINVVDNPFLDQPRDGAGYAVFGKVAAGFDTIDAIRNVPTTTKAGHQNVPSEPVVIEKAKKISADEAEKKIDAEKAQPSKQK